MMCDVHNSFNLLIYDVYKVFHHKARRLQGHICTQFALLIYEVFWDNARGHNMMGFTQFAQSFLSNVFHLTLFIKPKVYQTTVIIATLVLNTHTAEKKRDTTMIDSDKDVNERMRNI